MLMIHILCYRCLCFIGMSLMMTVLPWWMRGARYHPEAVVQMGNSLQQAHVSFPTLVNRLLTEVSLTVVVISSFEACVLFK